MFKYLFYFFSFFHNTTSETTDFPIKQPVGKIYKFHLQCLVGMFKVIKIGDYLQNSLFFSLFSVNILLSFPIFYYNFRRYRKMLYLSLL